MALPIARIYDRAGDVLAAMEVHATATGYDLPARRYVSPGLPAVDCDQMTIHAERTFAYEGDLAGEVALPQRARTGHYMTGVTLVLQCWRCVPVVSDSGAPPTVAAEEAAAQEVLSDVVFMLNAIAAGETNEDLPGCSGVVIENWNSLGPSGGFAGGQLRLRLSLLSG